MKKVVFLGIENKKGKLEHTIKSQVSIWRKVKGENHEIRRTADIRSMQTL